MDETGGSPKIQVTKLIVLQPYTQTLVEVTSKRDGLMLVDPDPKLFTNQMCLVSAGVANVSSEKPFQVLFANFGRTPIGLCPLQAIVKAAAHPANLVKSHINHGEMLGLILGETPSGKFRKHHIAHKNIDPINRPLVHQRESDMAEDEKPTTDNDIKVDVPPDEEDAVRNMLRKNENIWSGQLEEIKAT